MDATLNKSYKIAKQVTRKITVPEIINNVIANNSAPEGGGILCVETNARIINNTITNNTATDQGGGLCCKRSHPQVINTILYGNTANEGNQISRCVRSFPVINYSNIEGGSTAIYERNDILITDGIRKHVKDIDSLMALQMRGALAYSYNMDVVPAFENEAKFDFRLKDYSQCINTGTSDTLLLYLPDFDNTGNIRIGRNGIDMGAYELEKVVKDTKNSKTETIVNPLYNLQVQMYPNPTTGQFTLTILDNTFNVFTISIHNAMAQTVFTETCNSEAGLFSKAMDLSSEPKGVYALEIIADGMIIYSDKIILE